MKNKLNIIATLLILLILASACSFYNPLDGGSDASKNNNPESSDSHNKTLTDKTIDSTVGDEKVGIPECDEIIDFFTEQANSEDDNFVTKAAKGYALNKIRESFKKSIDENKGDTATMAKECRNFKKQLDKYKAEEDNKKK